MGTINLAQAMREGIQDRELVNSAAGYIEYYGACSYTLLQELSENGLTQHIIGVAPMGAAIVGGMSVTANVFPSDVFNQVVSVDNEEGLTIEQIIERFNLESVEVPSWKV